MRRSKTKDEAREAEWDKVRWHLRLLFGRGFDAGWEAQQAEVERLREGVAAANRGAKKNAAVNELLVKRECELRDEIGRLREALADVKEYLDNHYVRDNRHKMGVLGSTDVEYALQTAKAALGGEVSDEQR